MPELSRFYGIVIKMFFRTKEHNPPHIHALYGEYLGSFEIKSAVMLEGDLPGKARKMVQEWMALHREELLDLWETQTLHTIPPLE